MFFKFLVIYINFYVNIMKQLSFYTCKLMMTMIARRHRLSVTLIRNLLFSLSAQHTHTKKLNISLHNNKQIE